MLRGEREGFLIKRVGGFGGTDVERNGGNDRAVIRKDINLEKSNSTFCFAVYDLPWSGCCPPIFW